MITTFFCKLLFIPSALIVAPSGDLIEITPPESMVQLVTDYDSAKHFVRSMKFRGFREIDQVDILMDTLYGRTITDHDAFMLVDRVASESDK